MEKCAKCEKWFNSHNLAEKVCARCEEPWNENIDAPVGVNFPEGPPSHWDLLEKMELRSTRHEVLLPFAHDPKNYYVEAIVYEGKGHYWFIEGSSTKFKDDIDAIRFVVELADAKRLKALNDEFEKEFGNESKPSGARGEENNGS